MKRISFVILWLCFSVASGQDGTYSNDALYNKVQHLMDSTLLIEGNIFAPKAYARAAKSYESAREAINTGKKQKTIEGFLIETEEFAENTLKATEVAKLTLQEYLKPRENAKTAKAPMLVPELYQKAEDQFVRLEIGHRS